MKKFKNIFLIALSILTVACSKNSNNEEPESVQVDKTANLLSTGDSANDILSNDSFTKLQIEIGYVTGFRPTVSAMTDLVTFLEQHTFKQDIELIYKELDSPGKDSLALQEIADLESENRTVYNNGSTLAIYIYFTDTPAENDDEEEGLVTLGAVYRNTSMVIHEATIRKLASQSSFISNEDVETATLNHEFGHLFGLVNLGTEMVNDHEDVDAANHCNVQGCLMRAELQFGSPTGKSNYLTAKENYEAGISSGCVLNGTTVLNLLQSKTSKSAAAPGLDSECILDIQANGAR